MPFCLDVFCCVWLHVAVCGGVAVVLPVCSCVWLSFHLAVWGCVRLGEAVWGCARLCEAV